MEKCSISKTLSFFTVSSSSRIWISNRSASSSRLATGESRALGFLGKDFARRSIASISSSTNRLFSKRIPIWIFRTTTFSSIFSDFMSEIVEPRIEKANFYELAKIRLSRHPSTYELDSLRCTLGAVEPHSWNGCELCLWRCGASQAGTVSDAQNTFLGTSKSVEISPTGTVIMILLSRERF